MQTHESTTPSKRPIPDNSLMASQYTFCLPGSDALDRISFMESHRNMPRELAAEAEQLAPGDVGGPADFTLNMVDWLINVPRSPPDQTIFAVPGQGEQEGARPRSMETSEDAHSVRQSVLPSFGSPSVKESMTSVGSPVADKHHSVPAAQAQPDSGAQSNTHDNSDNVSTSFLRGLGLSALNKLTRDTHANSSEETEKQAPEDALPPRPQSSPIHVPSLAPFMDVSAVVPPRSENQTPFQFPSDRNFFSERSDNVFPPFVNLKTSPIPYPTDSLRSVERHGVNQLSKITASDFTDANGTSRADSKADENGGGANWFAPTNANEQEPMFAPNANNIETGAGLSFLAHTSGIQPSAKAPLTSNTDSVLGLENPQRIAQVVLPPQSPTQPSLHPSPRFDTPKPAAITYATRAPVPNIPPVSSVADALQNINFAPTTPLKTPVSNFRASQVRFKQLNGPPISFTPNSRGGNGPMQWRSPMTNMYGHVTPVGPRNSSPGRSDRGGLRNSVAISSFDQDMTTSDETDGNFEDDESKMVYLEAMLRAARREAEELENELMTGVCQAQTQDQTRSPNKRHPLSWENRPLHEVLYQLRVDLHTSWKDHCSKFDTQEQGYLGELTGRLEIENELQKITNAKRELESKLDRRNDTVRDLEGRLEALSMANKKELETTDESGPQADASAALSSQLAYIQKQLTQTIEGKESAEKKLIELMENQGLEVVALNEQLLRERARVEFLEQQTQSRDREISDLRSSLETARIEAAQGQNTGVLYSQIDMLQQMLANEQGRALEAWKLVSSKESSVENFRLEVMRLQEELASLRQKYIEERGELEEHADELEESLAEEQEKLQKAQIRIRELEFDLSTERAAAQLSERTELSGFADKEEGSAELVEQLRLELASARELGEEAQAHVKELERKSRLDREVLESEVERANAQAGAERARSAAEGAERSRLLAVIESLERQIQVFQAAQVQTGREPSVSSCERCGDTSSDESQLAEKLAETAPEKGPGDGSAAIVVQAGEAELTRLREALRKQSEATAEAVAERAQALAAVSSLQARMELINAQVDKRVAALIRARDREWSSRMGSVSGVSVSASVPSSRGTSRRVSGGRQEV